MDSQLELNDKMNEFLKLIYRIQKQFCGEINKN